MRPGEVTVRAPGKVNLYLAVGALDDDGYHEVRTVLQAVSLYDELTVSPPRSLEPSRSRSTERAPRRSRPTRATSPCAQRDCLRRRPGSPTGYGWCCARRFPSPPGMAGGSADAAAALVACDAPWGTGSAASELEALAAELGSDVPFSLARRNGARHRPRRRALAGAFPRDLPLGLCHRGRRALHPGGLRRTRPLSRGTAAPCAAGRTRTRWRLSATATRPRWRPPWRTTCKSRRIRLRPALRRVLDAGLELGAVGALVSGSGPTCAFLTRDGEDAVRLASELAGQGLCRLVRCAHGPVPGARVVS